MLYRLKILIVTSFFLVPLLCTAQETSKKASKFFNKGEFEKALVEYSNLDSSAIGTNDNFKIGVCYFLSSHNQVAGIPYMNKYIVQTDSVITVAYFYLGSLYHKKYEFDKSIEQLNIFVQKLEREYLNNTIDPNIYKQFKEEAETIIANCNYAKIMITSPRKVLAENLGDSINTKYQEYAPAISVDEKTLVFTARRPKDENERVSDDGDYHEDIFISELTKGSLFEEKKKYEKAKSGFFSLLTNFEYTTPIRLPDMINSATHDASIQLSA